MSKRDGNGANPFFTLSRFGVGVNTDESDYDTFTVNHQLQDGLCGQPGKPSRRHQLPGIRPRKEPSSAALNSAGQNPRRKTKSTTASYKITLPGQMRKWNTYIQTWHYRDIMNVAHEVTFHFAHSPSQQ
ncbi:hypothetical protein HOY80DRAFT_1000120 [Tuber brumale]|nr:hypothetical protein HOY80DRAFT_1000120 [Tuber brumale]